MNIQAKMRFDEKSLRRFAKVQYDTFSLGKQCLAALAAIIMILWGVNAYSGNTFSVILVFGGCWTLWSIKLPGEMSGDELVKNTAGVELYNRYRFSDSGMVVRSGEEKDKISFDAISTIVYDAAYIYLFLNKSTGYMIDCDTIDSSPSDLMAFLESKTGLRRQKAVTVSQLNPYEIIVRIKNLMHKRKVAN